MRKALLLSLIVATLGCSPARRPTSLLVGIDTSGSARDSLPAYASIAQSLAGIARPGKDRCTFFRFDYDPHEFYGPQPPLGLEEFATRLAGELRPGALRRGTRLASFLELSADRAKSEPLPCTIVVLTDGGDDDFSTSARARRTEAAKALAKNPKVLAVIFCGVRTGLRESVRDTYSALGQKLRVVDFDRCTEEVQSCGY